MSGLIWFLALLLGVWGYSKLSAKLVEGKITFALFLRDNSCIAGDGVEAVLEIVNTSWIPIPWFKVQLNLPEGLEVAKDGKCEGACLEYSSYLLAKQKVQSSLWLTSTTRGRKLFQTAFLRYSTGFGLQDLSATYEFHVELIVKPELWPGLELPLLLEQYLGDTPVQRWMQQDISEMEGIRKYVAGDSYKHINWRATARTGELMVKQFSTTARTELYLLVNNQCASPYWFSPITDVLERQYRVAASLLYLAEQLHFDYGLWVNSAWEDQSILCIPPNRWANHLELCHIALGGLPAYPNSPFCSLLAEFSRILTTPVQIILLTAYWDEQCSQELVALQEQGHRTVVITLGGETIQGLPPEVSVLTL